MATARPKSGVVWLSWVLTSLYGAALVVAALAGAYNHIKVSLAKSAASGSAAFPVGDTVFTVVVLGGLLALGILIWRQRIWAMWVPVVVLGLIAVIGGVLFPAKSTASSSFSAALGGGLLLFGGSAVVTGAITILATWVKRKPQAPR